MASDLSQYSTAELEAMLATPEVPDTSSTDLSQIPTAELERMLAQAPPTPEPMNQNDTGINVIESLLAGRNAALSPSPTDMAQGGFDIPQRFAQATAQNLYGQGRKRLVDYIPQSTRQTIGQGPIDLAVPKPLQKYLPKGSAQAVGDFGAGLGVDLAAGLGASGVIGGTKSVLRGISNIGKVPIPFSGANLGEVWNAGKNLKPIESELARIGGLPTESMINSGTAKGVKVVNTAGKSMIGEVQAGADLRQADLLANFKEQRKLIEGRLDRATQLETLDYKEAIKKAFSGPGGVSEKYGQGISDAEDALLKRGTPLSQSDYINQVIRPTLNEAQTRGIPPNDPSIIKIMDVSSNLKQADNFGINEAKQIKNQVYGELSGGVKRGTAPISDNQDQVANIFLRNHADYLGTMSPELAQLNQEAAPMYAARRWSYKNFQPYNKDVVDKGMKILRDISSGTKPSQDSINFLRTIEQGSGRFSGTASLRDVSSQVGQELNLSQSTFDTAKKRLIDATDYQISQIQKSINEDVSKVKSAGSDSLTEFLNTGKRKVELDSMKKELERLRLIKWGLVGVGATLIPGVGGRIVKTAKLLTGGQ